MPIAPGLLQQIAAQLVSLPELTIRRMFGGAGLYSAGLFFGVVDEDRVYFRAGDENRDDFKRAGSVAFQPVPDKPSMNYFSVPTAVLARSERFVEWARKAVAATRAAKAKKPGAGPADGSCRREPGARAAANRKSIEASAARTRSTSPKRKSIEAPAAAKRKSIVASAPPKRKSIVASAPPARGSARSTRAPAKRKR